MAAARGAAAGVPVGGLAFAARAGTGAGVGGGHVMAGVDGGHVMGGEDRDELVVDVAVALALMDCRLHDVHKGSTL